LEQSLHQEIAQQLAAGVQKGEKLSSTIVFGAPQFNTDHKPGDAVPSFSGTMTVQGEGDFYVDADVAKAYTTHLEQLVPTNQPLLARRITIRCIVEPGQAGTLKPTASPSP